MAGISKYLIMKPIKWKNSRGIMRGRFYFNLFYVKPEKDNMLNFHYYFMIKHIILAIFLFFFSFKTFSQGWEWAVHLGYKSELNNERVTNLVTDGTNYYAIGAYWGTLNTPGGVMYSNGINDIFIIKYDAAGNQIWARSIGGDYRQPDALEGAHGVYDPINNCIYIAGAIVGTVVFDAGVAISGSSFTKNECLCSQNGFGRAF